MLTHRLVSQAGDQRFDLPPGRSVIVGRGVGSDVAVYDPTISRRHAELVASGDSVILKDLGSSNGTYVNGRRVTTARLSANDAISFGKVGFRIESETVAPERPSPPGTANSNTIVREVAAAGPPPEDASARKLSLLLSVAQKLSGEFELDRLLETIAAVSFEVMRVDRVAILLAQEGTGELITRLSRARLKGLEIEHVSASIAQKALEEQVAVLTQNAATDPRFRGKSIQFQNVRSAMCSPLMASPDEAVGVLYVDNVTAENAFTDEDLQFLIAFSGLAAVSIQNSRYAEQARREAVVRSNFERYFAPDVAAEITRQKTPIQPGGERRAITVLFADIRGFTAIAERMSPDAIASMLTEYFSEMVDVIFEHGGVLDKFIGDALMALWGAPLASDNDPGRALQAARVMQQVVDGLNARWNAEDKPSIGVGIGINYGEAFVGNIGSLRRLEYTVIGDAVNVAQRLSAQAAAGEILVSDAFRRAAGYVGDAELQPPLGLRGKSRAVEVFRVRRDSGRERAGAGGSRREQEGAGGSRRE